MPMKTIMQMVGAAIGIAAGFSFLFLGFFETLLLIALAFLGWWLAGERKTPEWVINLVERIRAPRYR